MEWLNTFIAKFTLSVGGAIAISLGFLRIFGNRMLNHQFEKGLERYCFKINSEFDRISKIHQKEFEILPELWKRLLDAIGEFSHIANPVQEYPSLNSMSDTQLDEFLEKS